VVVKESLDFTGVCVCVCVCVCVSGEISLRRENIKQNMVELGSH
jgi:hypothetical protein